MKLARAVSRTGVVHTRQPDGSFAASKPAGRATKSFDAAVFNRLTGDWQVSRLSADAELQGKLPILRSRARDHEQNEPLMESLLLLRENNIVGENGFTLRMQAALSETVDPESGAINKVLDHVANRAIERAWLRFCQPETFLVTRNLHAVEALKLIERTGTRDGETLVRKVKGAPNVFGFALQLFEVDYLDDNFIEFRGAPCNCPEELRLPDGSPFPRCQSGFHEVRMGVELHGDWSFPVAYWLLANHPGDYFWGNQSSVRRTRVPVAEIVHVFTHKRIGQTRGLPAAVSAMLRLQMMGGISEAALVQMRAAAQKMGVITKEIPEGLEVEQDEYGDQKAGVISGEPGEFLELPMGFDVKSIDWKGPENTYGPFMLTNQYDVSASQGVSCHSLTGNLAAVNFSTARLGDTKEKDTFKAGQGRLTRQLLRPIFPDWLESAMLHNQVEGLSFARFDAYTDPEAVIFHGRGWDYFDPLNDAQATAQDLENGTTTRGAECAKRNLDFEQVTADQAREKQLRDEAGLVSEKLQIANITADAAAKARSASMEGDAPSSPSRGNAAADAKTVKSAFLGDVALGDLPADTQSTIARFAPGEPEHTVARYGMTVPELLAKADQHNLDTARHHIRYQGVGDAAAEVRDRADKSILLLNDRIVDGHHFLAKAEKGKVSSSLPVLDISPLRFQAKSLKHDGWVTIHGEPVHIGAGGVPDKGPAALITALTHAAAPAATPPAEARPAAHTATPVHAIAEVSSGGEHEAKIHGALDAIHSVHGLPADAPKVKIQRDGTMAKSESGAYEFHGFSAGDIKLNPAKSDTELTAAHEFGHYLDHQHTGSDGMGFGSEEVAKGPIADVMSAINKGKGVKELDRMAKSAKGAVGAHVKYLAAPREKLARAYSHYIAVRSQHPEMLKQLATERAGTFGKNSYHTDEEFAPVAAAFDKLFHAKGLRN